MSERATHREGLSSYEPHLPHDMPSCPSNQRTFDEALWASVLMNEQLWVMSPQQVRSRINRQDRPEYAP